VNGQKALASSGVISLAIIKTLVEIHPSHIPSQVPYIQTFRQIEINIQTDRDTYIRHNNMETGKKN
jgi:hypothetical protein